MMAEEGAEKGEFRLLVLEALEGFPDSLRRILDNLAVVVEDLPSPSDMRRAGVKDPMHLLGLYTGVPLTRWGRDRHARPPDVVKIFRLPVLFHLQPGEDPKEKVRLVVLHELGHRAGLDEGRLRRMGVY